MKDFSFEFKKHFYPDDEGIATKSYVDNIISCDSEQCECSYCKTKYKKQPENCKNCGANEFRVVSFV